jgi:hypothetical protein
MRGLLFGRGPVLCESFNLKCLGSYRKRNALMD